jgi:stearoyl-CoA desaturase (delta-9 desaturase)
MGKALTTLPFQQFRKNRLFYFHYDSTYLVLLAVAVAVMHATAFEGLVPEWQWWCWLVLPLACYVQILCSVFIHNATHSNFPRPINRIVGELCGTVVLTRFASWEIIHQRHHRYSDDPERDPHPVVASYWAFLVNTIVNVERQLQTIFYELHGDSPENRRYERRRAYLSYATNVLLAYAWYKFLGTAGFFFLFVPASILGFFHLVHFNWAGHGAGRGPRSSFHPANIDSGWLWLGNRMFFGIYMHANHHKRPDLFNPMKYRQGRATWQVVGPEPVADGGRVGSTSVSGPVAHAVARTDGADSTVGPHVGPHGRPTLATGEG